MNVAQIGGRHSQTQPQLWLTADPIFWLVARREDERCDFGRLSAITYFSGLYIDDEGILQRVNPHLGPEDMRPTRTCCTHTLNGVRFS